MIKMYADFMVLEVYVVGKSTCNAWLIGPEPERGRLETREEASFLEETNNLLGKNLIILTSSTLEMADIYFAGKRLVFWVWVCLSAQRASVSTIKG